MRTLLVTILVLFPISVRATPTHVITTTSGSTVAGAPSPGPGAEGITVLLEDESKIVLQLSEIKNVSPYKDQDLTGAMTNKGPILGPQNFRIALFVGLRAQNTTRYTLTQSSGTSSTSSGQSSPTLSYAIEAGYKPEAKNYGVFLGVFNGSYSYESGAASDSLTSVLLTPKYNLKLNDKLNISCGVGIGITNLSLGTNQTTKSGVTIALEASQSSFTLNPRLSFDYQYSRRVIFTAEAGYMSFFGSFPGTVTALNSTSSVTQDISRKWFNFAAGIQFLFSPN